MFFPAQRTRKEAAVNKETATPDSIKHPTFGTLNQFLDFLEECYATPRTLTSCQSIIQLVFLADGNLDTFRGPISICYHDFYCAEPLKGYSAKERIRRIRERISAGEISDDWIDDLKASMI